MAGQITPNAFLGRNTNAFAIVPQTVAADGTFSDGTSRALLGVTKNITLQQQNDLENITNITQRRKNNVIVESETSITIEGILLENDAAGAITNYAAEIMQTSDYFKVTLTRGKTGAGRTWTFYGVAQRYEERLQKGETNFTLELAMVDPGTANPALV